MTQQEVLNETIAYYSEDVSRRAVDYKGVCRLYEDGSEALVEDMNELDQDAEYGIEIGWEEELRADWQEAVERNNDKRNFESWLEERID